MSADWILKVFADSATSLRVHHRVLHTTSIVDFSHVTLEEDETHFEDILLTAETLFVIRGSRISVPSTHAHATACQIRASVVYRFHLPLEIEKLPSGGSVITAHLWKGFSSPLETLALKVSIEEAQSRSNETPSSLSSTCHPCCNKLGGGDTVPPGKAQSQSSVTKTTSSSLSHSCRLCCDQFGGMDTLPSGKAQSQRNEISSSLQSSSDSCRLCYNKFGGVETVPSISRPCSNLAANTISHLYAVDPRTKRSIWRIGENDRSFEPVEIDILPMHTESFEIVQFCAGYGHCVLLDNEGCVYTCGVGSKGELGHGGLESLAKFQVIEILVGVPIRSVAAGGWHSVALSQTNDAYVWGWNSFGELGFSTEIRLSADPQLLDVEMLFLKAACGSRHTVLLTDTGDVIGFGDNSYGQLGAATSKMEIDGCEMVKMNDASVADVFAIGWWTILVKLNMEEGNEPPKALPQKKYYRQRAHANPISDHDIEHPVSPKEVDWREHFPAYFPSPGDRQVEFADIGCGYGGLLASLATEYPDTLMLGLEIRIKVWDFVKERIDALRSQHPGKYQNVSVLRTNAMKYLPNYFRKHQLTKMFFLYPDPHFKRAKHKWRIVSPNLLAEYAYCLRPGGIMYTITDVREVHDWIVEHVTAHPLFVRLTETEQKADPIVPFLYESTEEGQKVTRNMGDKFVACFRRILVE